MSIDTEDPYEPAGACDHRPIVLDGDEVRSVLAGTMTRLHHVVTAACSRINGWPPSRKHGPFWDALDFEKAWIDPGPSPMGNAGPYLKARYAGKDPDWAETVHRIYPRWSVGDRFWVRETFLQPAWHCINAEGGDEGGYDYAPRLIEYVADGAEPGHRIDEHGCRRFLSKRPSIHMPRWASRITLEVVAVRPERITGCAWGWVTEFCRLEDLT